MGRTRRAWAAQSLRARTERSRDRARTAATGDEGFTLLEMLISIGIITIVMVSLTALYANTISSVSYLRQSQAATTVLTSAIDTARSIGVGGGSNDAATYTADVMPDPDGQFTKDNTLSGRDIDSVQSQFGEFSTGPVAPWIATMEPAWDATATAASTANLPTSPVTQSIGGVDYEVNYIVGHCYRDNSEHDARSLPCDKDSAGDVILFTRVVVAVTWKDRSCDSGTCYQIGDLLLNFNIDPEFNPEIDQSTPLGLSDCQDQIIVIGQPVNVRLSRAATTVTGDPICTLTGGVPNLIWSTDQLPAGLELHRDWAEPTNGSITGIAEGPPGAVATTVTVTDAKMDQQSDDFQWTVVGPIDLGPLSELHATVGFPVPSTPLTVTGGTGDYAISIDGALPDGLAITGNATEGYEVTGTPLVVGSATVTVTATDAVTGQDSTQSLAIVVFPPPSITFPGDQRTTPGSAATLAIEADCENVPCTFSANGLPNWLQIDPASGQITGIAPSQKAVVPAIAVTVTDSAGALATTDPFRWISTDGPVVVNPGDQIWRSGAPVSLAIQAICDPAVPCTWPSNISGLPPGLTWTPDPTPDPSGGMSATITGTLPGSATSGSITIAISDAESRSDSTTFQWTQVSAPTIDGPSSVTWKQHSEVKTPLSVSCSWGPCIVTQVGGTLPDGVTLGADAALAGVPQRHGSGQVLLRIEDAGGATGERTVSWTVASDLALSLSPSPRAAQVGTAVNVDVSGSASGGTAPYTFTASGLPSGLTMSRAGVVTGTPTAAGPFTATVTVSDSENSSVSATMQWTVTAAPMTSTTGALRSVQYPSYYLRRSSWNVSLDTSKTTWTLQGDKTLRTTRSGTERCLEDSGNGNVPTLESCNPNDKSQQWTMDADDTIKSGDGRYLLAARSGSGGWGGGYSYSVTTSWSSGSGGNNPSSAKWTWS